MRLVLGVLISIPEIAFGHPIHPSPGPVDRARGSVAGGVAGVQPRDWMHPQKTLRSLLRTNVISPKTCPQGHQLRFMPCKKMRSLNEFIHGQRLFISALCVYIYIYVYIYICMYIYVCIYMYYICGHHLPPPPMIHSSGLVCYTHT